MVPLASVHKALDLVFVQAGKLRPVVLRKLHEDVDALAAGCAPDPVSLKKRLQLADAIELVLHAWPAEVRKDVAGA